jgi:hypothetical protein
MIHQQILIPTSFQLLREPVWEDLYTFKPVYTLLSSMLRKKKKNVLLCLRSAAPAIFIFTVS